jgi:hypothetical protein
MANHACPRCHGEVGKAATDCAACGRPIAPVPWLQRLRGPGRRAPDAQVVDYARAVHPVRTGLLLVLWIGSMLGGAWGMWKVREGLGRHPEMELRVMGSMEGQGVPPHVREGVHALLDGNRSSWEVLDAACFLIVTLGFLGAVGEVAAFRLVRRLLGALPEPVVRPA